MGRPRAAVLAVGLVLAAVLTADAPAIGSKGPLASDKIACTKRAARAAIVSSSLPRLIRDEVAGKYPGAGIAQLLCHDFTRDGAVDFAAAIASGGTSGVQGWVLFRARGWSWRLAFKRLDLYKGAIRRAGDDVVEIDPVYRSNDPNCCPSGGFDHLQYRWRHRTMALVRKWHTKKLR